MDNLAGQHIKGYELQERIAAGGFGAVYRALQSTIGREVAVKVILPGLANKPDFIRRFEAEAQVIARLEHPFIVPLHDYWRDPDGAYLVMRYLRGGSLHDYIQKQGALSIEEALNLLAQLGQGLHIAHRHQVIHRDIKPGNILLDEDGNGYLADFGIAKDHRAAQNITEPDSFIGSPQYLAPEQARAEAVTPQTDVYSLGVVLYEMLAGEHPFPGHEKIEIIFKHLNDTLPEVTTLDDGIADDVNDVIQKATAKDPRQRFKDVMEMVKALRQAAQLDATPTPTSLVELLTPREQEVMQLIIDGHTNREIADLLVLTESTVKSYINNIYRKLKVRSRVQAIARARDLNFVVKKPEAPVGLTTSHLPEPENPYKGLRAFQAADAQDFFGRERMTKKLLSRLEENGDHQRFLAVVGPSGSGKSSVVKAGLIPALWRGDLLGSENWYIVDMIPGTHPIDELEVALFQIATDKGMNLREQLERDKRGLIRSTAMILPESDDGSELLLVIDQFEEVFTLLENEEQRLHFLDLIREAVTDSRSRVRVIVTLRADYYDRPLQYPDFGELVRSRVETVLPLGAEELERAIGEPAKRGGVMFEDGLVSRIVSDVHYQPGALPLMQYALTELFERRDGRRLTLEAYQAIGGTGGALANRADEIYQEFHEEGQELTRQMFLRLVTLGEGAEDTRRRVDRSELLEIASDTEMMDEIIDVYAASRLLSLDNDPSTRRPTVEVAHEAILREWDRLRGWLNESREDIRQERLIANAAEAWHEHSRDKAYLLTGSRLEQAEKWQQSTELATMQLEREFIQASVQEAKAQEFAEAERQAREAAQEQRSRNLLRALVAVFALAAVIAGSLALYALDKQQEAETEREEAQRQASIGLASQAMLELEGEFPDRAVPLALEAIEKYPYTWQAENALGQAVLQNRLQFTLYGHETMISYVKWSSDGSLLASASMNGRVIVWDAATGKQQHQFSHESPVLRMDWSESGRFLVTSDVTGIARIWDISTGEEALMLSGHDRAILFVKWSPDENHIIAGSYNARAIIWDSTTGETLQILNHDAPIGAVAWSPLGKQVVVSDAAGRVVIWDVETGSEVMSLEGHERPLNRIHWSTTSNRILSASDDGTAIVWDAATGEKLLHLVGHTDWIWDAQWSPDESVIVTHSRDGVTRIWDAETGDEQSVFSPGELGFVGVPIILTPLSFSPSGNQFAIARFDASVSIVDSSTGLINDSIPGHSAEILSLDWSQNDQLATGSGDGTVRIWDMSPRVLTLQGHSESSFGIDWSPDGSWIASSSADGTTRIWDAATGDEEKMYTTHAGRNSIVRWAPDSRHIAVNQSASSIQIIDTFSNEVIVTFEEHLDGTTDFDWSPAGERIVSSDFSGGVWIWDARTGEPLHKYDGHGEIWVASVKWSPDGESIISSDEAGQAHIWNAHSGELIQTLSARGNILISRARWSPDGTMIATHSDDDIGGRIWDVKSGEVLVTFKGHTSTVWGMDWSTSGDRLITTGMDGDVKVWDTRTGVELLNYGFPIALSNVSWSPDNRQIVFSGGSGTVRIASIPWQTTQELIDYAYNCCVTRDLTADERVKFGLPTR